MLEKMKNKKVWIPSVVVLLLIAGILSFTFLSGKSKNSSGSHKGNNALEQDKDEDKNQHGNSSGMKVVEDDNTTPGDSIQVPENWDKDNTDSNQKNDDTGSDSKKDDSDKKNSEEDTLKDETSWGNIF